MWQSRTLAPPNCREDSGALRPPERRWLITKTNPARRDALKVETNLAVGQKYEWLDEWAFESTKGPLPSQKALEAFAFSVCKNQWALIAAMRSLVFPSPIVGIPGNGAGFAFDLDQKDPLGAGNECVDLIDRSVIGDELEVGPSDIVILRRKTRLDKVERFLFPGEP